MTAKLWWMIRKDLLSEYRSRRAWPAMLLLGILVAVVFAVQMDLPPEGQRRIAGGLLWLAILFAGVLGPGSLVRVGKRRPLRRRLAAVSRLGDGRLSGQAAVNVVALAALEMILIPLFIVLSGVPLLLHPWAMLLVAGLGNVAICGVARR